IPWTARIKLHRSVAKRLASDRAAPAAVAEHWLLGREPERAREALLQAANGFCAVRAYRDGGRAFSRALALWPDGEDERSRLDVLQRLDSCAELVGYLGDAATVWREVADRSQPCSG